MYITYIVFKRENISISCLLGGKVFWVQIETAAGQVVCHACVKVVVFIYLLAHVCLARWHEHDIDMI